MAKSKPSKRNSPQSIEPKPDKPMVVIPNQQSETGGLPTVDLKKLLGCG